MRAVVAALVVSVIASGRASCQSIDAPDTVIVRSGALRLHALLWRPRGPGPFPAILHTHGSSGRTFDRDPAAMGATFARHGYVLLFLFRRGQGLSADQGDNITEVLAQRQADSGAAAFNRLQLHLLETDHLDDALAGLAYLRSLGLVDRQRIAVVGHSFGGSLALLLAERDSSLRAVVDFGGAAMSWRRSSALRARLVAATRNTRVPTMFVHAANDYSVTPGRVLDAEMARLGKPHRLKIYAAYGRTPSDGHGLFYLAPSVWERDVFEFLNAHVGSRAATHQGNENRR